MAQYRDIKGIPHSSEAARDSANKTYRAEEFNLQLTQLRQVELQKAQLELTVEHLREQEVQNQRVLAEQQKQTAILADQARREAEHLAFKRDLDWLTLANPGERLEYFLAKNANRLVVALASIVFEHSALSLTKAEDSLLQSFLKAVETDKRSKAELSAVSQINRDLEAARKAKLHGSAGCLMWVYVIAVLIIAGAFTAVKLEENKRDYDIVHFALGWALICFMISFITIPVPVLFGIKLGKEKAARKAAIRKEIELMKELDKAENQAKIAKAELDSAVVNAQSAYQTWIEASKVRLRHASSELLQDGSLSDAAKGIISDSQKRYPSALHIGWPEISASRLTDFCESRMDDIMAEAVSKNLTSKLFLEQANQAGAVELVDRLARRQNLLLKICDIPDTTTDGFRL